MTSENTARAPSGLGRRGRRFWRESVDKYEFNGAEVHLLTEACRTLDRIDALDRLIAEEGQMVRGSMGQPVMHPAIAESRQQRIVLGRLLKQLDLPDDADDAPASRSPDSEKASYAAQVRWSQPRRRHG